MYLKSLTLKGFKSFARPTTFAFEPGVTCVVGPNGSGKSNVVDALAWVMGEQGAKTLRGGKMEDVIFAGTAAKGPLGRAEVILTIDNTDGALPIEYAEVTISRTLFRNGASDYAINGTNCRLLDVQELLSDSGLGREMHVIVGQGQLDAVLRASPEERRGFIEEAAGILKHRRRKEKTLRKLDAMQMNLTRLSDLAGEIRRQLKPLGRQAEVAKEAQSIAAAVRDARARLLADEVVTLRASLAISTRSESEQKTQRIVLQEQLDQNRLRAGHIEQTQVGDAVDGARRTAFGLESVQERLRGLYTLAGQRLALLGGQSDDAGAGVGVTVAMVEEATAQAEQLVESVGVEERLWHEAHAVTASARAALDGLDEQIASQSALVSRHDLEVSQLAGRADAAASRLQAVHGELLRQRHALDAALLRKADADQRLNDVQADVTGDDDGGTDLDTAYEAAQAEVTSYEARIESLREELHTRERERDALAARTGALSSALDQKDGSSALVAAQLSGIRGLVAEHVKVEPGFEAAIAAALGSLADAVLADDRNAAIDALDHANSRELGRIELLLAEAGSGIVAPRPLPEGALPAGSVVTAPAGVLGLLAHVVIADDVTAARTLWRNLDADDRSTLTVITRGGDVLSRFVLRGGSGAKRSRLELVADRDAADTALAEVSELIETSRSTLAQQRMELQSAKERAASALGALREFDAQRAAHTEKLGVTRVQAESAAAEVARLERASATISQSASDAAADSERASAELDTARSRPRPILDVSSRDGVAADLDAARESEVQARLRVETARERVRVETLRAESLERQRERDRVAAEEAARRAVIRRAQAAAAQSVIDSLPPVLDAVERSLSEARIDLAAREAERSEHSAELSGLRGEESVLRQRLSALGDDVHSVEMQIYEKKLQLSTLLERAGQDLGLVEDVLVAEYGPDVLVTPDAAGSTDDAADGAAPVSAPGIRFDRAEQQARLARAERKLAQLGRVNPLALEEFAALEQRHKFLTEQLTDLSNTRKDLAQIIGEIDDKMRGIFQAAFEDTRAAFAQVFPVLFPGGTGSIRLTDPEDLLTTGIEVSVKPVGKKIERLSLLSGGERSLAAAAFLIAIFKSRPSPFYVLDEVEAALDDANLGRLLTIFEDLRESSQLIVITHQKRTMEIADALYGVSMRQDGISAVVGQRVAKAEQKAS
ncbi:MAG: chromosome segregation protein SMC [Terrimesophilobacter sp.]